MDILDSLTAWIIDPDDFTHQELIGEGGYAMVFSGIRIRDGLRVAVKMFFPILDPSSLSNFVREILVLSNLTHPCIIPFIGFALPTETRQGIIITKYLPNGSLDDLNKLFYQRKQFPAGFGAVDKAKILFGVAEAMRFLHANQILHRDLKPQNVFLDENFRPFIGDFGLARVAKDGEKGCPAIMLSPEIRDHADLQISGSGDVYSFAMTLYLSFSETDNPPLADDIPVMSRRDVLIAIGKGHRFARPKEIPDGYWELIQQAWDANPEARPTFSQICERMASPEFAIDPAAADEYMKYVEELKPR
jgi:serine/threonine protein kinase